MQPLNRSKGKQIRTQTGKAQVRIIGILGAFFVLCVAISYAAEAPQWWLSRGVLIDGASPKDYSPINQGQLKHLATAAYHEMEQTLPGGAGSELDALILTWQTPEENAGDFKAVNQGQLKALAARFYDRLIQVGIKSAYPWTASKEDDAHYKLANVGMAKNLFAFELSGVVVDSDQDGMADYWEQENGLDSNNPSDGSLDADGDGLTNLQEYQHGTNPSDGSDARGLAGAVFREVWTGLSGSYVNDLTNVGKFPFDPDIVEYVTTLESPIDWGDNYGSRVRGYIVPPKTGDYEFYVSGDNETQFFLSEDPSNRFRKKIVAYVASATIYKEWYKFESQSSGSIRLSKGKAYYFEVLHKESTWGDHFAVGWKIPGEEIEIIRSEYLISYEPSDNDKDEDDLPDDWEVANGLDSHDPGNVNIHNGAQGDPDGDYVMNRDEYMYGSNPQVPGGDGYLLKEVWLNIPGGNLPALLFNTAFPKSPTIRDTLDKFEGVVNWGANYGTRLRGFVHPPTTGYYQFSVAADNQTELWLGTSERKFSKRLIAEAVGSTPHQEYELYAEQQSKPIYLEAGKKYYVELLHKEGNLSDNYSVAWQVPGGSLEVIEGQYLSSYEPDPEDYDRDDLQDSWELAYGLDPADDGSIDPVNGTHGDSDNDRLLNRDEFLLGGSPILEDTDEDGVDDFIEAYLGTGLDIWNDFPRMQVPSPWEETSYDSMPGAVTYALDDKTFTMVASGKGIKNYSRADHYHYLHQTISGDFEAVTKVKFNRIWDVLPTAGWALLTEEGANSPGAAVVFDPNHAHFFLRKSLDFASWSSHGKEPVVLYDEFWLKLQRKGNLVIGYVSGDGKIWEESGRKEFDSLPSAVQVGLALSSGYDDQYVGCTFSEITIRLDEDGDGIPDLQESDFGTSVSDGDTDGDGYSDYEEIFERHSDPLVADLGPAQEILTVQGSSAVPELGTWTQDGTSIYTMRGSANINFTTDQDGIFDINLDLTARNGMGSLTEWEIPVWVDGQFVERAIIRIPHKASDTLTVISPWLKAGDHTVRFFVENIREHRKLQLDAMRLELVGGPDTDANGKPDWMDTRLGKLNGIESGIESYVSPYCMEGRSRFLDMFASPTEFEPTPAPADRWYANIPLSESQDTQIQCQFENGGLVETAHISWVETNLLTIGDWLIIRKGDSLRLAAHPEDIESGTASVEINGQTLSAPASAPITHTFSEAGTFLLNATHSLDGQNTTKTVELLVKDDQLADSPVGLQNQYRNWHLPLLTPDASVETDSRMSVKEEPVVSAGRTLRLQMDAPDSRHILARTSPDGLILGASHIRGLRVHSRNVSQIVKNPDGSKTYTTQIIQTRVHPDIRIHVSIFVGGVVFEDGTLEKTLTAEDFDELGIATFRTIKASYVSTSNCHHVRIYQGEQFLGVSN